MSSFGFQWRDRTGVIHPDLPIYSVWIKWPDTTMGKQTMDIDFESAIRDWKYMINAGKVPGVYAYIIREWHKPSPGNQYGHYSDVPHELYLKRLYD